jgi:hypothetical protein
MDQGKEAYEQRRQKATKEDPQTQVQKAASSYPHRAPQAQVTRGHQDSRGQGTPLSGLPFIPRILHAPLVHDPAEICVIARPKLG